MGRAGRWLLEGGMAPPPRARLAGLPHGPKVCRRTPTAAGRPPPERSQAGGLREAQQCQERTRGGRPGPFSLPSTCLQHQSCWELKSNSAPQVGWAAPAGWAQVARRDILRTESDCFACSGQHESAMGTLGNRIAACHGGTAPQGSPSARVRPCTGLGAQGPQASRPACASSVSLGWAGPGAPF